MERLHTRALYFVVVLERVVIATMVPHSMVPSAYWYGSAISIYFDTVRSRKSPRISRG